MGVRGVHTATRLIRAKLDAILNRLDVNLAVKKAKPAAKPSWLPCKLLERKADAGATRRDRTGDLLITNQPLYQLS